MTGRDGAAHGGLKECTQGGLQLSGPLEGAARGSPLPHHPCFQVKKLFRGAIEVGRNFPIMLVPVDGKRVEVSAFKKASFKEQLPADADMISKV